MKKILLITTVIALFAVSTFSQGRFLTRQIENSFTELFEPPFGAAAFADSTVTQSLTADTWSVVSEFVSIASNDLTMSDDTATIQVNGGYEIHAELSFYATASDTIIVQLFDNATAFGPKYYSTAGVILGSASISTYRTLHQGDKVTLKIQNAASNDDAVLLSGSLFLKRIYKN